MKKASLNGLTFRNDVDIDGDIVNAPITDSYKDFMKGAYSKVYKPFFRGVGAEPDLREDGAHTTVNETIDQSVFERWRDIPAYRPTNLKEWASRKKVDPAKIDTSVRADDPAVVAPD